jgi:hypothetical protein
VVAYSPQSFGRLALSLEGDMEVGSMTGVTFQRLETNLVHQRFALGGRADYAVWRWFTAFGRVNGGAESAELTIDDNASTTMKDKDWAPTASVAAGLQLSADRRRNRRLAFALTIEAAYTTSARFGFAAHPESRGDKKQRAGLRF